jgi:outer membrane protein
MRRVRVFLPFGLAALLLWGTAAQDEALKIGVVDVDQAIMSTEEGKAAREEFGRKEREANAQLQPEMDRYKGLEEDLKAKRFVLSDDALYQKQLDLVEMRNKIENKAKELQGQLEVDKRRLLGPIFQKLDEIVKQVGTEQGFTLIIRSGSPVFLYTREALDITSVIIERYNKQKS